MFLDLARSRSGAVISKERAWIVRKKWGAVATLETDVSVVHTDSRSTAHRVGFAFANEDSATIIKVIAGALPHGLKISASQWREVNSIMAHQVRALAAMRLDECTRKRSEITSLYEARVITPYRYAIELRNNTKRAHNLRAMLDESARREGSLETVPYLQFG